MSRLNELITQLCPDGVKFVKIGTIGECISGATPKTSIEKYWKNGTIPWMSSGEVNNRFIYDTITKITQEGYNSCGTKLVPPNTVVIALAGQGKTRGTVAITKVELCTNQSLCSIIVDSNVIPEFLYHYLRGQYSKLREISSGDGTRGGLNLKMIRDFTIPLPPLPVQEEIVRILNTFTELTAELSAELSAELTARNKQYEYYRCNLLTFGNDVPMVVLGDVAQYSKDRISALEINAKNYVGVDNLLPDRRGKTESNYVPESGMWTKYQEGDILIGNIRPYLKKIWRAINTGGTNGDVLVIHLTDKTIMSKYLYQLLCSDSFFAYSMQHAKGAKMPRGNKEAIMKYKIPVPPLDEQERIVGILDRFDTLCNDLTSNLPAEIEARRKQYEYYRDKLLTFKEVK